MLEREPSPHMRGDDPSTIVQFFYGAEKNEQKSLAANKPVHDEYEFIRITFAGDKTREVVRHVNDSDKERFASQYQLWKSKAGEAVDGTPLTAMKELNAAVIADLQFQRVFTVEALASLSDTAIQAIGMGAREWSNKAKEFLKRAQEDANAEVRKMAAENTALKADLDSYKKQLAELSARMDEMTRAAPKQAAAR